MALPLGLVKWTNNININSILITTITVMIIITTIMMSLKL